MKTFFKDYGQLWKDTGKFYKKHWLGTIIMNVVVFIGGIFIFWPKELRNGLVYGIKDKFKKNDEE